MNSRSAAAKAFAEVAQGFCAWCEEPSLGLRREIAAASWLSRLYAAALDLPDVEPENADGLPILPEEMVERAKANLASFNGSYYRECFDPDPTLEDGPVMGDIGDDLLDTYKDIKGGCAVWRWSG